MRVNFNLCVFVLMISVIPFVAQNGRGNALHLQNDAAQARQQQANRKAAIEQANTMQNRKTPEPVPRRNRKGGWHNPAGRRAALNTSRVENSGLVL